MSRPFSFSPSVKREARLRQYGKCAHCFECLTDIEEHAHHVVPNQSGNPANPAHAWLSSVDNCVVLCYRCHERVHEDGDYRAGAVAPPEYYPHSHGDNCAAHAQWAMKLNALSRSIWS